MVNMQWLVSDNGEEWYLFQEGKNIVASGIDGNGKIF